LKKYKTATVAFGRDLVDDFIAQVERATGDAVLFFYFQLF
jgi:hypothetical protein